MREYYFTEYENQNDKPDYHSQIYENRPLPARNNPDNSRNKGGYTGNSSQKHRHCQVKIA